MLLCSSPVRQGAGGGCDFAARLAGLQSGQLRPAASDSCKGIITEQSPFWATGALAGPENPVTRLIGAVVVHQFGKLIRGLSNICHAGPVLSLPKGKVKQLLNRLPARMHNGDMSF